MPYIFAAAAVLAVISILFVFKINLDKIRKNPELKEKAQTNYFIGLAIAEAVPLILIVIGFINMQPVGNVESLYAPGLIILLMMGLAVFFVNLQKRVDVTGESRQAVNQFSMLVIPTIMAIPFVSLVALFLMAP